ncbi:MAG: hypothetical protein QXS91_00020 [Candidatus Anstonellales archaeon]
MEANIRNINPPDYPDKLLGLELPPFISDFLNRDLEFIENKLHYLFFYWDYEGHEKEGKIKLFSANIRMALEKIFEKLDLDNYGHLKENLLNNVSKLVDDKDLSIIAALEIKVKELLYKLEKSGKEESKKQVIGKINSLVKEFEWLLEFKEKIKSAGYYNILFVAYRIYESQDLNGKHPDEINDMVESIKDKNERETARIIANWISKYYITGYATKLFELFISRLTKNLDGLDGLEEQKFNPCLNNEELKKAFEIAHILDKKRRQNDYKRIKELGGNVKIVRFGNFIMCEVN